MVNWLTIIFQVKIAMTGGYNGHIRTPFLIFSARSDRPISQHIWIVQLWGVVLSPFESHAAHAKPSDLLSMLLVPSNTCTTACGCSKTEMQSQVDGGEHPQKKVGRTIVVCYSYMSYIMLYYKY